MSEQEPTAGEIWNTLSKIDVSEYVKIKNKATYLSWPHAWMLMMQHYPQLQYRFTIFEMPDKHGSQISDACFVLCTDEDGKRQYTASVEVTVSIGEVVRTMWLPVMTGFMNLATPNPGARDIGDTKMRCLVKCFAMFGLGHYIFAGEDLPIEGAEGKKNLGTMAPMETIETESRPAPKPADPEIPQNPRTQDPERMPVTAIVTVFENFLEGCESLEELKTFWNENKQLLLELKSKNEKKFTAVVDLFKTKQGELS